MLVTEFKEIKLGSLASLIFVEDTPELDYTKNINGYFIDHSNRVIIIIEDIAYSVEDYFIKPLLVLYNKKLFGGEESSLNILKQDITLDKIIELVTQ